MGKKVKSVRGFTLVEIMIVVAILGIISSVAVPNFVLARRRAQQNSCIGNMRSLERVIEIARAEGDLTNPSSSYYLNSVKNELVPRYLFTLPICPYLNTDEEPSYQVLAESDLTRVICLSHDPVNHDVNEENDVDPPPGNGGGCS